MDFLNKFGLGAGNGPTRNVPRAAAGFGGRSGPPAGNAAPVAGGSRGSESDASTRVSNGLKELLWNLEGLGRGTLLDLGPAWQTTLSFFIERGFRVTSDDLLRSWKAFMTEEETRLREDSSIRDTVDTTPAGRATRFLE